MNLHYNGFSLCFIHGSSSVSQYLNHIKCFWLFLSLANNQKIIHGSLESRKKEIAYCPPTSSKSRSWWSLRFWWPPSFHPGDFKRKSEKSGRNSFFSFADTSKFKHNGPIDQNRSKEHSKTKTKKWWLRIYAFFTSLGAGYNYYTSDEFICPMSFAIIR